MERLEITGAKVHNLQNISLSVPRKSLITITGLSGSGKSSLAFDTIYAEGQRRYLETFSAYARSFIGGIERPDVEKIIGLEPVISIEQKTTNKNPRSTVGTTTEIYDLLRLLYARISDAYSYNTGELMVKYTEEQILDIISKEYWDREVLILSPLVKGRRGHYRELFESMRKKGFLKIRIDGSIENIVPGMQADRYKIHDIELVVDKIRVRDRSMQRLKASIKTAFNLGKNTMMVLDIGSSKTKHFSKTLMCPTTGISYAEPEPNTFSFNSPYGACPHCNGLGEIAEVDLNKIIPDRSKSLGNGGLGPLSKPDKNTWFVRQLIALGREYDFDLNTPFEDMSDEALDAILYGSEKKLSTYNPDIGMKSMENEKYEGIVNYIQDQISDDSPNYILKWAHSFMNKIQCPKCEGARLRKESLHFRIEDMNIAQLANMDIIDLSEWCLELTDRLEDRKKAIGKEILREINTRIQFLLDVGLGYLSLNRSSRSLSGGESQRIRLATQIGSQLVNVLYILDEPSIGLHQRDNVRLIEALKQLRDIGNSVIVVEHDKDMMLESDWVVDIGPGAGKHGGKIIYNGEPEGLYKVEGSITGEYLKGSKAIEIPKEIRPGNGKYIKLNGASGNNLKDVDLELPLGCLVLVTGVSGSGKSTLINNTLQPILSQHFHRSEKKPLPYKSIEGMENLDKVIEIDQQPIGRTPRSNPATYIGVFDDIRELFSSLPTSRMRGYKPGRFSFNVKGGRCETCRGAGVKTIEMNFLPNVYVVCEVCNGKRYNRETLEVRYKGKTISQVLDMSFDEATEFFESYPSIYRQLNIVREVGLGYLTLGQPSTTLSGGESQRIKLATELSKKDTGKTLYVLDEPTTGLHFEDIRILLKVLEELVNKGNSMIIIEHNLDVIKVADYIIDLGPEGGKNGGYILAEGSPREIINNPESVTGQYLKKEFK